MAYKNICLQPLERPYEKIKVKGAANLSDKELLAIIIQSGMRGQGSMELADALLNSEMISSRLSQFLHLEVNDYLELKGIGLAKASRIAAAIELGKRAIASKNIEVDVNFNTPELIYKYLSAQSWEVQEVMVLLLLDCHNRLLRKLTVAKGDLTQISFNSKTLLRTVLRYNTKRVVLVHNHPSGNTTPSETDMETTRRLHTLFAELDIELVDHLIIGSLDFLSIRRQHPELFY